MNINNYNEWATYRRKMLDYLQNKYKHLYKGIVLDIGGRNRGKFKKPIKSVNKWIFADINESYKPDIILDVSNMSIIESNTIDVVNAIELFEHVENIKKGLKECYRVLKNNGIIIISMPFLFPLHADPFDFQRWTNYKWCLELRKLGFKIEKFIIMGNFYTHLAEMLKMNFKSIKKHNRIMGGIILKSSMPFLDFIVKFDTKPSFKKKSILNKFHNGYFIIAKKKSS